MHKEISSPQHVRGISPGSSKQAGTWFTFPINQCQVNQLLILLDHETFEWVFTFGPLQLIFQDISHVCMSSSYNCVQLSDRPGISHLQLTCAQLSGWYLFSFHFYFISCKTVLIFNCLHNRLWKYYSSSVVALGLSCNSHLNEHTHVVELGWRKE